jgi:hypothetical protein
MRSRTLAVIYLFVCLFGLFLLAACGPQKPTPVPPRPQHSPTSTGVPATGTATTTPTVTKTPTATGTPTPTNTATPTNTPTATTTPLFVETPAPAPTTLVGPAIDQARNEYNAALNKWRSQGIWDYEITVDYQSFSPWAGTWVLRVTNNKVGIQSYSPPDGQDATPSPLGEDTLNFLTVDGQFASIEHILTNAQRTQIDALVDYLATFDPKLGYPSLVEIRPKTGVRAPNLGSKTAIKQLKVYGTGAPQVSTALPVPTLPVPTLSPTP